MTLTTNQRIALVVCIATVINVSVGWYFSNQAHLSALQAEKYANQTLELQKDAFDAKNVEKMFSDANAIIENMEKKNETNLTSILRDLYISAKGHDLKSELCRMDGNTTCFEEERNSTKSLLSKMSIWKMPSDPERDYNDIVSMIEHCSSQ